MHIALKLALAGLTGIAGLTDLYARRIPNVLVVAGFAAGFGLNTWLGGWSGMLHALQGFGLAALIYVPLFLVRAMGGGDVKLMAAAGAIVGPRDWFTLFVVASVAGAAIALGMLVARNAMGPTFWNILHIAKELARFRAPHRSNPALDVANPRSLKLPHAVPIAIGAAVLLMLRH